MTTDTSYHYDPTRFREVFEHQFSYVGGVQRNNRRFASRPALHDPATGRRWTYSELWQDSGKLASGLSAAGVAADNLVVFDLLNGPEFAILWLAAQRLGAVAAPINFRLAPARWRTYSTTAARARSSTTSASRTWRRTRSRAQPTRRRSSPWSTPTAVVAPLQAPARSRSLICSPRATISSRPRANDLSGRNRPGSIPRGRPGCPRGCRSTRWSRSSRHTM